MSASTARIHIDIVLNDCIGLQIYGSAAIYVNSRTIGIYIFPIYSHVF